MNADLRRAILARVHADHANFHGANLGGATFARSHLRGSMFQQAQMPACNLMQCDLRESRFDGAQAQQANFAESDLSFACFADAVIDGAVMASAVLLRTDLHNCSELGVNWEGARLTFVSRTDPDRLAAEGFKPS
jgi:uncharacterized protein YjbI with pentapeptide repeats